MIPVLKKSACFLCALASVVVLSGCGSKTQETLPPPTLEPVVLPVATKATEPVQTNPNEDVEHLAVIMQPGELYTLDYYPNLKSVDLSGSTCYDAILDFMSKRPHLNVSFTVSFGGSASVSYDVPSLTLNPGTYTYEALQENLQYLPNVTTVSLPGMDLNAQQVSAIEAAYPEITLDYTVDILGNVCTADTTTLDLSGITGADVDSVGPRLAMLTKLETVRLNDNLTFAQVDKLQSDAPHITFDYRFSLFGKTISTADEEVIYEKHSIGNEGEGQLREALTIMEKCKRFVLDSCGFDSEVLAKVRDDFRATGPKVVWRIRFGVGDRYTTVTDDDTIRAVYNVTDDTCGPMKYLEDVKYMDLGHNEYLTDFSFVGYMPQLEVLIGSGSAVQDLSGIENCKKLTWLELASCLKLENIEPLAGCEGLKYLNLSYTKVTNLEPLDTLPLERFVYLKPKVSAAEQETFLAIHPKGDCITVFYGYSQPYGYGWRYDDNGKTMFWYYKDVIRKVFNYDQADKILDAQKKAG